MKSVEPNADLPPASSHTMLTYSALPVRRPHQQHREGSRNMTGVYLSHDAYGLPSNKQQQQRIPPLARPRGVVYQPPFQHGYHRQAAENQEGVSSSKKARPKQTGPGPIIDPEDTLGSTMTLTLKTSNRTGKNTVTVLKHKKAESFLVERVAKFFTTKTGTEKGTSPGLGNIGLRPVDSRTYGIRPCFIVDDDDEFNCDFLSPNIFTHPFQLSSPPSLSQPYCYIPPNLPYAPPLRVHLPLPPYYKQQHQHDTLVRKRGDIKAFQPMPIKRAKPKVARHEYHGPSPHVIGPNPDYRAVTRKSARNRVPASNDGITHFEELRSLSSGHSNKTTQELEVIETMLDSIDMATSRDDDRSLAGLVQCYKKICKGNAASVHNLVASRQQQTAKHKRRKVPGTSANAPLVIRSFRNPQHPHSVVQYTNPKDRSMSPHSAARPPVPAPYFYSSRGLPQTADEGGSKVKLSRLPGAASRNSDTILVAPGGGAISRSSSSRVASTVSAHRLPEGLEGVRPPTLHQNTKIIDSDEAYLLRESFNAPASTPVASVVDINKDSETGDSSDSANGEPRPNLTKNNAPAGTISSGPGSTHVPTGRNNSAQSVGDLELTSVTADSMDMGEGAEAAEGGVGVSIPSLAITLSVENEDGTFENVDLADDEKDTTGESSGEADHTSDEIAEKIKESQAQKQAELDQLLEEHHQLVSHIEELEKVRDSSEGSPEIPDEDD